MEAKTVHTAEMPWADLTDFPGKGQVKVLRDEGGAGARTLLIRIHPDNDVTPHAHEATVQHYVLEGEYESENRIYAAGTHRLLPPHTNVGAITTQNGATVLLVYDPVR